MRNLLFVLLLSGLLFASSTHGEKNILSGHFVTQDGGDTWSNDGGLTWNRAGGDTPINTDKNDVTAKKGTPQLSILRLDIKSSSFNSAPPGKYYPKVCIEVLPSGELELCDLPSIPMHMEPSESQV